MNKGGLGWSRVCTLVKPGTGQEINKIGIKCASNLCHYKTSPLWALL